MDQITGGGAIEGGDQQDVELIPAVDNTVDVGSTLKRYREGHFVNLFVGTGDPVLTGAGGVNLDATVTTTQTVFGLDQELITKKYVDDTHANSVVTDVTTLQTMTGSLKIASTAVFDESIDDTTTTNSTGSVNRGIGFEFVIAVPITITHFRCAISKWTNSTLTVRKMRIFDVGTGLMIHEADINKATPSGGWYETSVGPFVIPPGTYATSCYNTPTDKTDLNNPPYSTTLNVSRNTISNVTGTDPDYPGTFSNSTFGYMGHFVFYTGDLRTLEAGRVTIATGPLDPQDATTKSYVDTTITSARGELTSYVDTAITSAGGVLPSLRMTGYDYASVKTYIETLKRPNVNSETLVAPYAHGVSALAYAYQGGSYSPTQNRIYFGPYNQGNVPTWHYVDCNTGTIVPYTHGSSAVFQTSFGTVYSPTQNRIYFVPFAQSVETQWHFIDCNTGGVVAYEHLNSSIVLRAYANGVYSPLQNRIYFVPLRQANQIEWHYVDCSNGAVVAYTHGVAAVVDAYASGVYSPTQNRIYLIPYAQAPLATWHYIDCTTGAVVAYTHAVTAVTDAYKGGVYSPTQNRIYMIPRQQATAVDWHYIDCDTGAIVAYQHGVAPVATAYDCGVLSVTQNRIYMIPLTQGPQTTWHYIDCDTGAVVGYASRPTNGPQAYNGGVYCPSQDRIYFVPREEAQYSDWVYLQPLTGGGVSRSLASSTLMGN